MPNGKKSDGSKPNWLVEFAKIFERLISRAIKAEKTTTGRINLIGIILVGLWAILTRQSSISPNVAIIIVGFIVSSVISDLFNKNSKKT